MTVLCSVVKHLCSGLEHSRRREKHSITSRVSPYTSFVLQPLLACFKTARTEHSLVVNYNYNFSSFQSKTDSNTTIAPKTASCPVIRFFGFCWTQLAFFQLFITFMIQTAHSCPSKTASYEEFKPPLLKSFLRGTNILRSRKGVHKLTIKSETLPVKFPVAVMHEHSRTNTVNHKCKLCIQLIPGIIISKTNV